jgi:hypothetical protein
MKNKILLLSLVVLFSIAFISALDISTCQDLQNINNDLTADYVLTQNIDCSDTVNWNDGYGFLMLGVGAGCGNPFTGTLDGQGYSINNLYINGVGTENVSMMCDNQGTISNLNLVNVNITGTGGRYVGALLVYNDGLVENVNVSGIVTQIGETWVGGFMAGDYGTTINSHFSGDVIGTNYVGGFVADAGGGIETGCSSSGTVTGNNYVGGFASHSDYHEFHNSYSTSTVNGDDYVGGFIGYFNDNNAGAIIDNCYATGDATGNYYVGGLVGYFAMGEATGLINNSYATGDVVATLATAGGFAGIVSGVISNSYSTGSATSIYEVGGFIGTMDTGGDIYNSYSIGNVINSTPNDVGGFVGLGMGTQYCNNCFWDIQTSGQTTSVACGTGKTTSEMKDITTFSNAGWTITTTTNNENNGYPFLLGGSWVIYESQGIIQNIINGVGKTTTSDTLIKQEQLPTEEQTPVSKVSLFAGIKNWFQSIIDWFKRVF